MSSPVRSASLGSISKVEATARALRNPANLKQTPLPKALLMRLRPLSRAGTRRRTGKGYRNGQDDCTGRALRALGLRQPARLILLGRKSFAAIHRRFGGYD